MDICGSGVLIEGATPNVNALVKHTSRRPLSKIFGKAVCREAGVVKFIGDGGTAGMVSMLPKGHLIRWSAFWKDPWKQEYDVNCAPLREILAEAGVTKIDFLSVDVSGAESVVIETLDFGAVNVRVIVVEMGHSHADEQARDILKSHGFCFAVAVAQNEFWTSDVSLKERFCH